MRGTKRLAVLGLLIFFAAPGVFAGTIYFAQVADGGGFSTTFTLLNAGRSSTSGILRFYSTNGSPRIIRIGGRAASQFNVTIPAGGSTRLSTDDVGFPRAGWASLESDGTLQGIGTFDFRDSSGRLVTTAAVLSGNAVKRVAIPVEISSTTDTGIAVANISTTGPVTVRLRLVNEAAEEVANVLDPRLALSLQQHVAEFVTSFFPGVPGINNFRGTLYIETVGTGDLSVTGLVVKEGLLSALPVVDLGADR